jgi:hypothetical protein
MKKPHFPLGNFSEGELKFAPTFKYNRGKNVYDTSEKQRIPAYCDRILFRGEVKQTCLNRIECRISDHRPVFGKFLVQVDQIDHARFEAISKSIYEDVKVQSLKLN